MAKKALHLNLHEHKLPGGDGIIVFNVNLISVRVTGLQEVEKVNEVLMWYHLSFWFRLVDYQPVTHAPRIHQHRFWFQNDIVSVRAISEDFIYDNQQLWPDHPT